MEPAKSDGAGWPAPSLAAEVRGALGDLLRRFLRRFLRRLLRRLLCRLLAGLFAAPLAAFATAAPAFRAAVLTFATPFFIADLAAVVLRPTVFFAAPVLRFAAGFFALMARSTLPAAFFAPVAAAFTLRLTVRFALPNTFFASASTALALLFTVRFALPSVFLASASAAFALRFTLAVAARVLVCTSVSPCPLHAWRPQRHLRPSSQSRHPFPGPCPWLLRRRRRSWSANSFLHSSSILLSGDEPHCIPSAATGCLGPPLAWRLFSSRI